MSRINCSMSQDFPVLSCGNEVNTSTHATYHKNSWPRLVDGARLVWMSSLRYDMTMRLSAQTA